MRAVLRCSTHFFGFHRFDPSSGLVPLVAEGEAPVTLDFGGLPMAAYPLPQQEVQFDLVLQLLERSNDFVGMFTYRADLFDEATLRQFAADYLAIVEAVADNPHATLADLPASSRDRARSQLANNERERAEVPVIESEDTGSVETLIDWLRERDIRVFLEAGKLKVNAPKGAMTEAIRTTIAARKTEIVATLTATPGLETRAAVSAIRRIPRDGRLPVSSAQRRCGFSTESSRHATLQHRWVDLAFTGLSTRAFSKRRSRNWSPDTRRSAPAFANETAGPKSRSSMRQRLTSR